MKNLFSFIIAILTILAFTSESYALKEPKPTAVDKRIRVVSYNPGDVYKFTGYYGYQANIEFAEGENVETISLGDTIAWQIVPMGKRIFLKPMEPNATTNMTVLTNLRIYYFELHAEDALDINDPKMVFSVKFLYPDEGNESAVQQFAASFEPDLSDPNKYNFSYTLSGSDNITPLRIFDDGEFTYFKFRDKNAEIPAFFVVDSKGEESLVNYRVAGQYIIVERVTNKFTLRHGHDVVCVFNESVEGATLLPNSNK